MRNPIKCKATTNKKKFTYYGDFKNQNMEFEIKNLNTPRPWINYLSNGKYTALISQTGGGYSFYLDSQKNRITRWRPENYLTDEPGRYLYIYDIDTKNYFQFNGLSALKNKKIKTIHRPGLTTIHGIKNNLEISMEFFVPININSEYWLIKIKNLSKQKRNLKIYPFIEWMLADYFIELQVRNITTLYNLGYFDKNLNAIITRKKPVDHIPWPYMCYFSSTEKILNFEIDYENFIGQYKNYMEPEAIKNSKLTNVSPVLGLNMVGVLEHKITLNPGKTKEIGIILGIEKNTNNIKKALSQSTLTNIKKEKINTIKTWDDRILNNVIMETKDKEIDQMVNTWLKYEVYICNYVGRSASYYHEGAGVFGYRNTAQDAFGLIPINPEYAKNIIIKLARHQRQDGECLSGWSLETGPHMEKPTSDFPAWMPFLLNAYVKGTGNIKILEKSIKYFDKGEAALYKHALQGIRFLQDRATGKHHLPLMGTQDWNDALDKVGIKGKGESVMLAMQMCWALQELKELASFLNEKKVVNECQQRYQYMKNIINKYCWDGNWYIMAYDDSGKPLGTKQDKECKIYLNSQSWAVIAGITDEEKEKKIIKIIDKYMNYEHGIPLFVPPYTEYQKNIGRITAFAPGTKENAAIFYHADIFLIYAYIKLGLYNKAYDLIKLLMPNNNRDSELYKVEPYTLPEYIIGPGNTRYGEGAFSWITGTAPWLFIILTQYLTGIIPDYNGLKIKAKLPDKWKKISIKQKFQNKNCYINILKKQQQYHYNINIDMKKEIVKTLNENETILLKI